MNDTLWNVCLKANAVALHRIVEYVLIWLRGQNFPPNIFPWCGKVFVCFVFFKQIWLTKLNKYESWAGVMTQKVPKNGHVERYTYVDTRDRDEKTTADRRRAARILISNSNRGKGPAVVYQGALAWISQLRSSDLACRSHLRAPTRRARTNRPVTDTHSAPKIQSCPAPAAPPPPGFLCLKTSDMKDLMYTMAYAKCHMGPRRRQKSSTILHDEYIQHRKAFSLRGS